MLLKNENPIKYFFQNITGLQYYLIYLIFNYILFRAIVLNFLPKDFSLISSMSIFFMTIPLIASYYRFVRLNIPNWLFLFWVIFNLLSIFFGVDFTNYDLVEENYEILRSQGKESIVIISTLTGLLQLFFILPMNLVLLFKNAKKKKILSKEQQKLKDEKNAKILAWIVLSPFLIAIIWILYMIFIGEV